MPTPLLLLRCIAPARAPTLLVAALGLLLAARDASDDMVASLAESPREAVGFQGLLFALATLAFFFGRAALGLHEAVAAGERGRVAMGRDALRLWTWWPRILFGAVAATGALVSARSGAPAEAVATLAWAGGGVILLHRRERRLPAAPAMRTRLRWADAFPGGRRGACLAVVLVAAGTATAVLAGAEGLGLRCGLDLPATLSAAAPRAGAAVLCFILLLGPLTALTMVADRFPLLLPGGLRLRVPVLLGGAALLTGAAGLLPLHQVRLATRPGPPVAGRVPLDTILASFAATCAAGGPAGAPVRPVIVALSGGASRAALWSARVLRDVDASAAEAGTAVFALSSVSGGSLGAAAYLALRRDDDDAARSDAARCRLARSPARDAAIVRRLRADMLGPLLVGTVLDDTVRALLAPAVALVGGARAIPRGGDRAEALERAFSRAWGGAPGRRFAHGLEEDLLSFFYDRPGHWRAGMPVWISNGTDVRTGRRLLTSPVRPPAGVPRDAGVLDDPDWPFWSAGDVLALLGADVPVSTAIHNSARFPLLSPSGAVMPRRPVTDPAARGWGRPAPQIVDGGYFENSGLTSAVELAQWARARTIGGRPVDPVVVLVTADAEPAIGGDEVARCASGPAFAPAALQTGHEVPELAAPLATLFATREGHADYAIERARHLLCGDRADPASRRFFHFYLHAPPGAAAIPLNWTLSATAAAAIWRGMRDDNPAELAALALALRSKRAGADATGSAPTAARGAVLAGAASPTAPAAAR